MKNGTTHLAHKAEHAVDLESGALVGGDAASGRPGRHGDPGGNAGSRGGGEGEAPEQVVADKGYHSAATLLELEAAGHRKRTSRSRGGRSGISRGSRRCSVRWKGTGSEWAARRGSSCRSCGPRRSSGRWRTGTRRGAASAGPARAGEPPQAPAGACLRVQPGGADEISHGGRYAADPARAGPAPVWRH